VGFRQFASYAIWLVAVAGFAAAAFAMLPQLGAGYDFVRGTEVLAHIVDRSLTPLPVAQNGGDLWPVLLLYLAAYWIAYFAYEQIVRQPIVPVALLVFALGAAAALAVPFLPTTDPYAYALYGVEAGPLGLNPYAAQSGLVGSAWGPQLLALFPAADSYVRVCNYGPVFALLYGVLAVAFEHASLVSFVIAERALGLAALVFAALGFAYAEPHEDAPARAKRAATFAFHPLVLFEFVAFAHGDAIMIALLAWAYAAWRRDRTGLAGILCATAAGVRVVALVGLAALAVATIRTGPKAFGRATLGTAVAFAAIGGASYIRFGALSLGGPPVFGAYSSPWLAAASLLGLGERWSTVAIALGLVAGAAIAALVCYKSLRTGSLGLLVWLPFAALVASPNLYSHYFAWFTSLRSLTDDALVARVAQAMSLTAPLLYVIHVDPFPYPGASVAIQCGVLALVWIPVLVAALAGRRELRLANQR
jgi:hypothetical protein